MADVGCFIHSLQLCIEDAVFSQRAVIDITAKCRTICTHFSHSVVACEELKRIQTDLGLPLHKMIQDVRTRWNSTYYMLERSHEQRQALMTYGMDHDIPLLTHQQWGVVANILRVLQPFEELTKTCSYGEALISVIIPSVNALLTYLGKRQKDSGVQTMKEELRKAVVERFVKGKTQSLQSKELTIATLLDPRFMTAFFKVNILFS